MAELERFSISEARAHLGEIVMKVYYTRKSVLLTKNGKVIAAISPISDEAMRDFEARNNRKDSSESESEPNQE